VNKYLLIFGMAAIVLVGGYHLNRFLTASPAACDLANYTDAIRDARLLDSDIIDLPVTRVTYLDQGWTPADSMDFYTRTQGSRLIPYSWFLALEQPGNNLPFRADDNMNSFRYLPQKKNDCNPDGLPVGFVKDLKRPGGQEDWLGLNCAACHTNEVHYKGTAYRIDGAPTMSNMDLFMTRLTKAMRETVTSLEKFDRLAKAVLPLGSSDDDRAKLKAQLDSVTTFREQYNARNQSPHAYGFARLDAFGRILNEVLVRHLKLPEVSGQSKPADAPVSYPFLWDTPHHDFVQWNAIAANRIIGSPVIGSLSRNVGEVLGVFGEVEIPPMGQEDTLPGYNSSVRIGDLRILEKTVAKLYSPLWPAEFPTIEEAKRVRGQTHFVSHCQVCHKPIPDRKDPNRVVKANKTPVKEIRTDSRMATNFSTRRGKTGPIDGRKRLFLFGDRFEQMATGDEILVHVVLGTIIKVDNNYKESELLQVRNETLALNADSLNVYKGRPLNGIWATAPYLHNGSVPNLWELLKPAKDRVATFSVGSREFDPVHVGFRSDPTLPGAFVFHTLDAEGKPIPGNGNFGHEYGTGRAIADGGDGLPVLTDTERWELLEFLKSL